jgi:hypothetical protein
MSRPTWAKWVTRVALGLAVIALVLTIRHTGVVNIASYFRRIGWWWIAVAALEVAITSLDAIAIRAFLAPDHRKVRLRSALLAQLAGRAVNAFTPSGNLGEAVKVSVLVEHVSQSRAVSTILLYNAISFSVELLVVACAVPFVIALVPMPAVVCWLMIATCALSASIALALHLMVRRGALTRLAPIARWLYVAVARIRRRRTDPPYAFPAERYERWQRQLHDVADKMRASASVRRRDRWLGTAAVVASRLTSMSLSFMILHAVGEPITPGFVAAYTVGGFLIYLTSNLVPMGVGISEGGNYWLFRALGENPARGVTLVLARRVTQIAYAAIGLVLVTASETVQRARERQASRGEATGPLPSYASMRIAESRLMTAASPAISAAATKAGD